MLSSMEYFSVLLERDMITWWKYEGREEHRAHVVSPVRWLCEWSTSGWDDMDIETSRVNGHCWLSSGP